MSKVSRRAFVVIAATAAVALPAVLAQQSPPAVDPPKPSTLSPAMQAEAEARIQLVLGKYGARLTDAQKADVRRIITGGQAGFESLRAYPLDNAAEPAATFRAYRGAKRRPSRISTHERKAKS